MASVVEIANQALLRVGDEPIISLGDANERGRAFNASWPFVRREVLRAHPWNIAVVRIKLAALADAPSWGFATAYEIPADSLQVLEVDTVQDWRVEGREIRTDATGELSIRYTKDETNSEIYDGILTAEIAERLTNSRSKRELLLAEYEDKIQEARMADGEEGSPSEFEEDAWVTVRH